MVDTPRTYESLGVLDSSALFPFPVFSTETPLRGIFSPKTDSLRAQSRDSAFKPNFTCFKSSFSLSPFTQILTSISFFIPTPHI